MTCVVLNYAEVWNKDPDDDTAFVLDWDDVLAVGDTISASSWISDSTDADAIVIGVDSFTNRTTDVQVSGGECAKAYELTNTITTAAGYTLSRTVAVGVKAM